MENELLIRMNEIGNCIIALERICDLAYMQNSDEFAIQYNDIAMTVWKWGDEEIRDVLISLSNSQDIIFISDELIRIVIPKLKKILKSYKLIDIKAGRDYRLISTESGFFTLYNQKHNRYMHSLIDPVSTARRLISSVYDSKKNHYYFWGIGLGYELQSLYEVSNGSICIDAYEEDEFVFECAKAYGALKNIPDGAVNYHVGDVTNEFLKMVKTNIDGYFIHLPSVFVLSNISVRSEMMNMLIRQSTFLRFGKQYLINIRHNMNMCLESADVLTSKMSGSEIVVVAAGPSLDENINFLKERCSEKNIFAVGTVYRKLVKKGIKPDAVFVNDPQKRTTQQFEEIENEDSPLIIDAVAHWEIAELYKGPKYIAWTALANIVLPEENREFGYSVFPSSSTVTGFAVDYAIRCNAKKIYLVGVDLAYPTGKSHASDTLDIHDIDYNNMYEIESNSGGSVYTNDVFDLYRKEIEIKIKNNTNIMFINKSHIGAKIEGAISE